ncbi:MAG: hypothetical protein GF401_02345 [Chitinivibrionales bacterium]|nr:hypothetical protein [Chitinivibrionales bacterium]
MNTNHYLYPSALRRISMKRLCNRWTLLTLLLLATFYGSGYAQQSGHQAVRIKSMIGKVEVRSKGAPKWRPGRVGMPVRMGWDIRTYVESSAELQFKSGTIIKVGENSVVTLSKALMDQKAQSNNSSVKVATGKIWANVKKMTNKKSTFDFETPTAVASIRGTKLGISVGKGETSIDVYEGLVMVKARGAQKAVPVSTKTRAVIKENSSEVNIEKVDDKAAQKAEEIVPELEAITDTTADSTSTDTSDVDSLAVDTTRTDSAITDSADIDTAGQDTTTIDTIETGEAQDSTSGGRAGLLNVLSPQENMVVKETPLSVKGTAVKGAVVTINGKEVALDGSGGFNTMVDLDLGNNVISITATSDDDARSKEITVRYQPALVLNVSNIVENMEVISPELPVEIEISEGASYSINGTEGASSVELEPGPNRITVKAWDDWGGATERTFLVTYKKNAGLILNVASPKDGDVVEKPMIPVMGTTTPGAKIEVNGARVPVDGSGAFSYRIPIPDEPQDYPLEIVASLDNEEVSIERGVTYEPETEELMLAINSPTDGQVIRQRVIRINGKTSSGRDVIVEINGRRATVSPSGIISNEIPLTEADIGEYTLEIVADDGIDEKMVTMQVTIDDESPQINTSVPTLIMQGHGQQATRIGQYSLQVLDRTPDEQITVTAENNGSREEYVLSSGDKEMFAFEEGKNEYSIKAVDKAGNISNVLNGKTYYLPGPLLIDIIEPFENPYVVNDLPPMPRNVTMSELNIEIELDAKIDDYLPEIFKYCRIEGPGVGLVLDDNKDFTFSGTIAVPRGTNVYTITAEDIAGNIGTKQLTVKISE